MWLIACSHRWHGQDKTVLSCLVRVGGVNRIGDKTRQFYLLSTQFRWVLSCLGLVSNLQLSSLKYIEDYWKLGNWKLGRDKIKLSCLVSNCVHTADTRTIQDSFVLSVLVVWTGYKGQLVPSPTLPPPVTAKQRVLHTMDDDSLRVLRQSVKLEPARTMAWIGLIRKITRFPRTHCETSSNLCSRSTISIRVENTLVFTSTL